MNTREGLPSKNKTVILIIYLFYAYDSEIIYLICAIANIQYKTHCINPPCLVAAGGGVAVLLW
jgi:hypothetical protein